MKDGELNRIRDRLLEERQGRIDALTDLDSRLRDRLETGLTELTKYPLHPADEGTDTYEQEKEFLLASQEGRQFVEIDEALRKLYKEPDRFGVCERCGAEITLERLELVPWARYCIDCKRVTESGVEESAA